MAVCSWGKQKGGHRHYDADGPLSTRQMKHAPNVDRGHCSGVVQHHDDVSSPRKKYSERDTGFWGVDSGVEGLFAALLGIHQFLWQHKPSTEGG